MLGFASTLALLVFLCVSGAMVNDDKAAAFTRFYGKSSDATRQDDIDSILLEVIQKWKSKTNYIVS